MLLTDNSPVMNMTVEQEDAELIKTMVPEAESMSYQDALNLAAERDLEAAEELIASVDLAEQLPPDLDILARQTTLESIPGIRRMAERIGLIFLSNAIDLMNVA